MNFLSAAALSLSFAFSSPHAADPDAKLGSTVLQNAIIAPLAMPFGPREEAAPPQLVSIPERLLGDLQADLDLEEFQAAAIVGNLAHETGNFRHLKEIQGLGYGYSQWSGPRRAEFFAFAGAAGGKRSYEANYGFLLHELTGQYSRVLKRLRKSRNLEEATSVFMKRFLAPAPATAAYPRRLAFARSYLAGEFAGAGCLLRPKSDRIDACPDT